MIKGILLLIVTIAACAVLWVGMLSILIQPGSINHTNGFTVERSEYVTTRYGRLTPVIVEDSTTITYTLVVHK